MTGRPAGAWALPPEAARTFRFHWGYCVSSAASAGILTNAPTVAIKALGAADWQLALPTTLSGVGLLAALLLGVRMAGRHKMPFVLAPGFLSSAAGLGMLACGGPLGFLVSLGAFNLFDTLSRPAITAVIRANYPAEVRGRATGRLRQWSSGVFLVAAMATGWVLDRDGSPGVVRTVLMTALVSQAAGFALFACIRILPLDESRAADGGEAFRGIRTAILALGRDRRFVRYLVGCFLFGAGGLMYEPIVRAYLSEELHLDYTRCVLFADVLPSLAGVLTVHRLGIWIDRTNPLGAWSWIRLWWGLDPLLLALTPVWPEGMLAIVTAARLSRGAVMGASWVLWWQLGTNYFADRRELTATYMGLHLSLNGVQRIAGPFVGAVLRQALGRREILIVGCALVLLSAWHARRQARAERAGGGPLTFADRERRASAGSG